MKEKILLGLILILFVAIAVVNLYPKNNNDGKNSGIVKGAHAFDTNIYNLSEKIHLIPKKSANFYDANDIMAQNYILIDSASGIVLAKKNEHDQVPIASTTKIMTAIVALEKYELEDSITITDRIISGEESALGLIPGDSLKVKDLLAALLINSANDASYALADHIGYDKFIESMNHKSQYLGLENTHFKDPAGFSDEGKSSAYDLAFITKYALLNDTFRSIVKSPQMHISSNEGYSYKLDNSNRLIKENEPLYYPEAIGIKTGFTYDAGHCLVAAATSNGHTLIAVVLHTDYDTNDASAIESKKLLEWGYSNYTWE